MNTQSVVLDSKIRSYKNIKKQQEEDKDKSDWQSKQYNGETLVF